MTIVPLSNSDLVGMVDDEWSCVLGYNWNLHKHGYVCCTDDYRQLKLHRLVLCFPSYDIDHKDRNKRNCQLENLRPANHSQNAANSKRRTGMYKGVSWKKDHNKWQAQIVVNYKHFHLGYFTNPIEAAKEYDAAALKHFGGFANTNF